MIALRGITWSLWQRNRVVFLVLAGLVLAISALLAVSRPERMPEAILALTSVIVVFAYLAMVGVFVHPDADVGSAGSSYPSHMLTLPVRTSQLVIWPMLLGTAVVFSFFGLLALAVRYGGVTEIPQFWPPMLGAALLAVLQAIFWYPLGIPYSKLVLTFLAVPGLATAVAYANVYKVPEREICAGLGLVIVASALVAWSGVSRARRGDVHILDFDRPSEDTAAMVMPDARPCRTVGMAQAWYEWRLHGIVLPVIAVFLFALFCVPMAWDDTYTPLWMLGPNSRQMLATAPTYLYSYLPVLLVMVPLAAWVIGCGAKRSDIRRSDQTFHLFFSTRPLSDGALVAQKLWAAALSTAAAWAVTLVGLLFLLTRVNGSHQSLAADYVSPERLPILAVLAPYLNAGVFLHVGAVLLLLVAITWRNYAVGFWTELSGKLWLRYAYPLANITAISTAIGLLNWSSNQSRHWLTVPLVVQVIWIFVVLKLVLAFGLVVDQYRSGSLKMATIVRSAVLYAAGGGLVIAIGFWMTATLRQTVVDQGVASPAIANGAIVALVILWTPMVRVLAARTMLGLNRHR